MVETYEVLRQRALAGDSGTYSGGLGIFVGQGMGAWIEVCSQLLPDPLPPSRSPSDPACRLAAGTVERELVVMMTQMILSSAKEMAA